MHGENTVEATMLWIIDVHIVDNDMDGHIRPHEHEYHICTKRMKSLVEKEE